MRPDTPPAPDTAPPTASTASSATVPGPDIRLVVVDLDGTLLDGDGRLPAGTFTVLAELRSRGIVFAPASGRQHATIVRLFAEDPDVAAGLVVIAENGALVTRGGQQFSSHPLDLGWSRGVVQRTRGIAGEGADLGTVVCGVESAWVERTDDAFMHEVERYYARLTTTSDLLTVDDDVLKIAVHDFGDPSLVTAPALLEFCAPRQVVVSGHHWVDVMEEGVHKGLAVHDLQRTLGISAAQTMAFGDFLNDLEMLEAAEHSWAMANAHPSILELARHVAPANTDDGVLRTIREVLDL